MINKVINRIWMGNEIPDNYAQYGEDWATMNPDWEVRLWTEKEIFSRVWTNQKIVDTMIEESHRAGADMVAFWTHVADVICPEIIYESGGFYTNTDMKPIRPLSELDVDWHKPWIAKEDDHYAVNMAMWSPGHDSFFEKIIED